MSSLNSIMKRYFLFMDFKYIICQKNGVYMSHNTYD